MDRVQLILSLDLLLRLQSCNPLLPSDCLHCLKAPTNLFDSITLSNTFVGSTSVTILLEIYVYFQRLLSNKIRNKFKTYNINNL